jgi:hypothetical protein
MYLTLATVTGVHLQGVRKRLPAYCTVAQVFHSLEGVVHYKSIKRESKTRLTHECRCDERPKTKSEESTLLTYTGFLGELGHLKTKTRLIDEMFASRTFKP